MSVCAWCSKDVDSAALKPDGDKDSSSKGLLMYVAIYP